MAYRFSDSFDHYSTSEILQKWTNANSAAISAGNGRRGTACLSLTSSTNVVKRLDSQATWIFSFSFYMSALPSAAGPILTLLDGGTTQIDLRVLTDGTIRVTRNGTTLATSTNALSADTVYHIQMKGTIDASVGVAEVRVNGSSTGWINATGQNTRNTANSSASGFRLDGISGSTIRFDDLYVCDGTGSLNNDFPGDVRVDWRPASGNGNSSQLLGSDGNSTDNYQLVDDSAPNGDTDYVSSVTTGQKDTYNFANLAHVPTNVFGIQIIASAKASDAGLRSMCAVTRSGGSDTDGASKALTTSYKYYRQILETDPNTSSAWTAAGVNAAQIGVKVAA